MLAISYEQFMACEAFLRDHWPNKRYREEAAVPQDLVRRVLADPILHAILDDTHRADMPGFAAALNQIRDAHVNYAPREAVLRFMTSAPVVQNAAPVHACPEAAGHVWVLALNANDAGVEMHIAIFASLAEGLAFLDTYGFESHAADLPGLRDGLPQGRVVVTSERDLVDRCLMSVYCTRFTRGILGMYLKPVPLNQQLVHRHNE